MSSNTSYLDRAQQKLADLERRLGELPAGAAVADTRAELEATRERLEAVRLQGAEAGEEALQGFARRLEELTARIGALASGRA